jgi:hypothetical protein
MDNLIDSSRRDADVLGQAILTDFHRLEELLEQNLPGVNGRKQLLCHGQLLVVVGDFDVVRITPAPSEADAPLVIDPDAVLSLSIASEPLKPVPWGYSQLPQRLGCIQEQQLPVGLALHVRWQPPRSLALEYLLRLRVMETPDHASTITHVVNIVKR